MSFEELREFLDSQVIAYNNPNFISSDPVAIPKGYILLQDVEIMGFFAATLAWGQRITIINNCNRLSELMDFEPHKFILDHSESDLVRFNKFVHRTFNPDDTTYFIRFLKWYYLQHNSLEQAFSRHLAPEHSDIGSALSGFHNLFFLLPNFPKRTIKHVSTPLNNSACKRLCMYLRWMVRKDLGGVDFGIWNNINPSLLVCPLDVHSGRVARSIGLLERKQNDWKAAIELTENLRKFDPIDPVKYDFALFGLGVSGFYR